MSAWSSVGGWLKDNGTGLLKVAGAVATGNIPGGIAAVASMVSEATGETDPKKALMSLKNNPELLLKLEEITKLNEQSIREHHRDVLRMQLEDEQKQHEQQQLTIRSGDNAVDEVVRKTRPEIARQSWYATMVYVIGFELLEALSLADSGASIQLAAMLVSPCGAYMGFRTIDKIAPGVKGAIKSSASKLLGRK